MRGWGRHFRSPQTPQSSTEGGPVSILLLQEEILVIHMTPHSCCQRSSKGCGSTVYCAGARQGKARLNW